MPDRLAMRVDSSLLPPAHIFQYITIATPPNDHEIGHLCAIVGFGLREYVLETWTAQAWAMTAPELRPGHAEPMTMGGMYAMTERNKPR